MPSTSPRVAIVGAGFSGVALAHHLAHARRPPEVVLVERRPAFGPGLAYRTADPLHLLNVPAGRMSALAGDPDHLLRWARARDPAVHSGSFLPRGVYGAYLRELVDAAAATGAVTCLSGQVVSVRSGPDGPALALADGRTVAAARVVLAVGNFPPALPPSLPPALRTDPRYVADPWDSAFAPPPDAEILVLGTALTAVDLALGLRGAGHRGTIHLLSRHGLLPHAHRPTPRAPILRPPDTSSWPATTRGTLRAIRRAVAEHEAAGGDWRDVIADLRPITPSLWRRLPLEERDRFLRHLRTYWAIHRRRLPAEAADAIADMRARGQLRVRAGRIEHLSLAPGRIALVVRPRGGGGPLHLAVDRLVNATGPASDPRRTDDPLLHDLIDRGLLVPEPLGAAVADDGALLDAAGRPSSWLFTLGTLRRPQLWETTAALEIAPQAEALARRLVADLAV